MNQVVTIIHYKLIFLFKLALISLEIVLFSDMRLIQYVTDGSINTLKQSLLTVSE